MIGIRTALIMFVVLTAIAAATLKGPTLYLALVIILGLAMKSVVHHFRTKVDE